MQWNTVVIVFQSPNRVWLFVTPWTAACQASLSLTISHSLPKLMFIASVMPSSHLILWCLFSFCPQSLPASGTFPMSCLFASDDQNTGASASASASALQSGIQGWFPLRLTGLISFLSKGLSGVFSSTTVRRYQFFVALPSLQSSFHNIIYYFQRNFGKKRLAQSRYAWLQLVLSSKLIFSLVHEGY